MKKTFAIGAISIVLLAVACGLSYLEILMFKALDLTVNGVEYAEWLTGIIRAYWPIYAVAGIICIALSVALAKSIYAGLEA